MAAWLKQSSERLRLCWRFKSRINTNTILQSTRPVLPHTCFCQRQKSIIYPPSYVPPTSLSRPPWPELPPINQEEEERKHQAVMQGIDDLLQRRDYGRLFAIVHFASRQWKVTNEDLILIENHLEAECGDRIRLEKVLLVGGDKFSLIGEPLLSRDLVRVEATVIEKTESWPMAHMVFRKRHRFQKKRIIVQPQTVLRINTIELSPAFT